MARDYDAILTRLIDILTKLSNGELYNTKELASEYNVSVRTIQKDIYERLCSYPIEKDSAGKFKFIDGFSLNKSTLNTEEMLLVSLSLSQFKNSKYFKKSSNTVLKKLLYPKFINPYYIKNYFEPIEKDSLLHTQLKEVIKTKEIIEIFFDNNSVIIHPYKIANFDGFWDLFAKDIKDNKIKTYPLYKIKKIKHLNKKFYVKDEEIEKLLNQNVHSSWFEDGQTWDVIVLVKQNIAHYFKRKKFLQSQKILKEYKNGDLKILFKVSHDEDIDNIIKSWLPDIYVLEPLNYKQQIKDELENYLKNCNL